MKVSGLYPAVLLILMYLWACESREDVMVDFPDAGFLKALIDQGADLNADGMISRSEAEAVDTLEIGPYGITDLTGLACMSRLRYLDITLNPIGSLEVSANLDLRYLSCTSCELTDLDVSRNIALRELHCGRNRLDELDLGNNLNLSHLSCNNNRLDSLDLGMNSALVFLITCGNRFPFLDLSSNTKLVMIGIDNMPMLEEVCVWILPFPPVGVEILKEYSPNVHFSTACISPL